MPRPNVRKVVCANCDWSGTEDEVTLDGAPGLDERLTPGDEVPAGECPECLCFCYLVKPAYVGGVK